MDVSEILRASDHFPALTFAVGGQEKIYLGDHRKPNGAYIEHAVDRAMELYRGLPVQPTLLCILDAPALSFLGKPAERTPEYTLWKGPFSEETLRKLFREIIRAELDASGLEALVSSVYLMHPDLVFFLYDDRGAKVMARDGALLEPLKRAFPDWILA